MLCTLPFKESHEIYSWKLMLVTLNHGLVVCHLWSLLLLSTTKSIFVTFYKRMLRECSNPISLHFEYFANYGLGAPVLIPTKWYAKTAIGGITLATERIVQYILLREMGSILCPNNSSSNFLIQSPVHQPASAHCQCALLLGWRSEQAIVILIFKDPFHLPLDPFDLDSHTLCHVDDRFFWNSWGILPFECKSCIQEPT